MIELETFGRPLIKDRSDFAGEEEVLLRPFTVVEVAAVGKAELVDPDGPQPLKRVVIHLRDGTLSALQQGRSGTAAALRAEIQSLRGGVASMLREKQTLQDKLASEEAANAQLRASSSKAAQDKATLEAELAQLKKAAEAELEKEKKVNAALREELDTVKQELAQLKAALKAPSDGSGSRLALRRQPAFVDDPLADVRASPIDRPVVAPAPGSVLMDMWKGSGLAPPARKVELLYADSGMDPWEFHRACDGKGPTVTLLRTTKGAVFGGFTPVPWSSDYGWEKDESKASFIFVLKSSKVSQPIRLALTNPERAVWHDKDLGPIFGESDIWTENSKGCSWFPKSYGGFPDKSCFDVDGWNFEIAAAEVWLWA